MTMTDIDEPITDSTGISSRAYRTVDDLCRVTGLDPRTVRTAIVLGELPGYRIGKQYRIPVDAFERFLRGEWTPQPRPMFVEPVKPARSLIQKKGTRCDE